MALAYELSSFEIAPIWIELLEMNFSFECRRSVFESINEVCSKIVDQIMQKSDLSVFLSI